MRYLTWVTSNGGGKMMVLPERGRWLLGRADYCQVVLHSDKVSRRHAILVVHPHETWLFDLESANGTWVNRQKISRAKLSDGDVFSLGPIKLTFHDVATAALRPVTDFTPPTPFLKTG